MLKIFIFHRCLEYLLRNDANPGIRDKQGYNAVHYSAAYGHRLCLELVSELNYGSCLARNTSSKVFIEWSSDCIVETVCVGKGLFLEKK